MNSRDLLWIMASICRAQGLEGPVLVQALRDCGEAVDTIEREAREHRAKVHAEYEAKHGHPMRPAPTSVPE